MSSGKDQHPNPMHGPVVLGRRQTRTVDVPGWGPAEYEPHELALVAETMASGAPTAAAEVELLHAMKAELGARVLTDGEAHARQLAGAPAPEQGHEVTGAERPAEPAHEQGRLL